MKRHLKNFPFNPAGSPFYYGWVILVFGTVGTLMSAPGQTVGVSVFTDFLIRDLGITRNFLSLAYLIGTITSALLLTRAGKSYDKVGARLMTIVVSAGLGLVLVYLSFTPGITAGLRSVMPSLPPVIIPMVVMSFGFFLLRFLGQGSLTLVSKTVVMEWFEKRRGLANGVLGVAVSFGFSYAPRLLDMLIGVGGWQHAWRILAAVVGIGFSFFAFIFLRNRPEDHGLLPDGGAVTRIRKVHAETTAVRDFTVQEARRTYGFWIATLTLFMAAMTVTAFTFHVVSVFDSVGLSREKAVSIFLPVSFIAVAVQFGSSYVSDYIKIKYLIIAQIAGNILLCLGVIFLRDGLPFYILIIGMGINQGLFGVNGNIVWVRFFGRKHLGAVTGFATSWIVAGSAVGPYFWSLTRDLTGSYSVAAVVALVILTLLFLGAWKAERPSG